MRNKTSAGSRPRPKTIHVDSGGVNSGVDMQEGILSPSRSKKGSTSNLTGIVSIGVCSIPYFHVCLCCMQIHTVQGSVTFVAYVHIAQVLVKYQE
jgi:hypothetical protein